MITEQRINNHTWHLTGLKYCYGPLHPIGGELLRCVPDDPEGSGFYFYKRGKNAGKPTSICKRCFHHRKTGRDEEVGKVPIQEYMRVFRAIQRRIGKIETFRRLSMSTGSMWRIRTGEQKTVLKPTYKKAVDLLRDLEQTGEVRHPDDIHRGTAARGLREERRRFRHMQPLKDIDYAAVIPVKPNTSDPYWWIVTESQEVPRWGEEMLGADF